MSEVKSERKVLGKECRFAIHIPTKSSDQPDLHLVKEIIHYDDNTSEPNIKLISNFKRKFWVTKPAYRNHEQKKEFEEIDKLTEYECTQSDLRFAVAQALDMAYSPQQLNQLAASPYLYGSDISSTAIIKHGYQQKYPDYITPYNVGFFDIETDVLHGTNDPILATYVYKDQIWLYANISFYKGYSDIQERIRQTADKYIKPFLDKHNFKLNITLCEHPVELIKKCIYKMHETSPDIVAIWNIDFDIPRVIETLEKYNVNPAYVFSDPKLKPQFKFAKYKKGSTKKITASGQVKPKNPSEQWHTLYTPAGFMFLDAMSSYRFIRLGGKEQPEYNLDYILNAELGLRKLSFQEADHLSGLDKHEFLQENYPFEYTVYNIFDCIGMYELEEEKKDLSLSAPGLVKISDFAKLDSQTKRFADNFHYYLLKHGKVIATVPPSEKFSSEEDVDDEIDYEDTEDDNPVLDEDGNIVLSEKLRSETLALKGWIVTLKPHLSVLGLPLIIENKELLTLIRLFVYDSDAVSAYPSAASVANVCKATTVTEIIDFIGIDEESFRRHNINFLQGHVNAIEYCTEMFKLPQPQDALIYFTDLIQ